MHTEKIDVSSGMAILQGPVALKIGVVSFCTLPLICSHLTKNLPCIDKIKFHFFVAAHKTIVAKAVGNRDMHKPAKYEAKIQNFAFSKAKTLCHFP
jgi:hypothetical protein